MAKILISSLGTGNKKEGGYRKARYEYDGEIKESTFISKALCEFLNIDKLFLVGTNGSIWDSVYTEFGGDSDIIEMNLYEKIESERLSDNDLKIVEETIENYLGSFGSKCFLIDYGVNENELWQNFEIYLKILEHIKQEDEVYIDISHSFRSLALMSFLMVQFGHTIREKDFTIKAIFYGMLEYQSKNGGITPIVDLKIFYDLMEWMKAIENLTKYGNADKIAELLDNKNEKNLFNNFSLSLRMANMAAIKESVRSLSKKLDIIEKSNHKVVNLLGQEVVDFIRRLDKSRVSDFQLELADWFCEHKHYALGYLALVEAIVSKICELEGLKIKDKEDRNRAKSKIFYLHKKLGEVFKSANDIRKDIAHQLGERKNSLLQDAKSLSGFINKTRKYFNELDER